MQGFNKILSLVVLSILVMAVLSSSYAYSYQPVIMQKPTPDGDEGNDKIHGGQGPDAINGGAENDQCHGGQGANTFENCESTKGQMVEEEDESEPKDE
jgi:Ca2+-binding RTX toxin-like protein